MARKPSLIEGQQPLFYGDGASALANQNPNLAAHYQAVEEGVPMVDVLDRAHRITEALTEMGRMSSVNVGFLTAVNTPNGARIWSHYRRATPFVERNARNKLPRREKRVKELLGPATGYLALRLSEDKLDMGREEINARARHTWERFKTKFSGPDNDARRQEYKSKMARTIRAQNKLRKRLGVQSETDVA